MKNRLLLTVAVLLFLGLAVLGSGMFGADQPGLGVEYAGVSGAPSGGSSGAALDGPTDPSKTGPDLLPVAGVVDGGEAGREAAPASADLSGWATLRIRAIDGLTRDGVTGARIRRASSAGVRFRGDIACTPKETDGEYELRWRGPALLDFEVDAPGFLRASVNAIAATASEDVALVEMVRPARLIVHADGFTATAPGSVELYRGKDARRGSPMERQPWKGKRSLVFEELSPGTVTVVMTVEGCPPGSAPGVVLMAGKTAEVTVSASQGESVQGMVVEASTEVPLSDVTVRIRPEVSGLSQGNERAPFPAATTDLSGRFLVKGIPVGRAVVTLEGPGGARVEREIVVREGSASREIRLRMTGTGTLSGRVQGSGGFRPGDGVLVVPKGDARSVMGALLNPKSDLSKARGTFAALQPDGSFTAESVPCNRQLLALHRAEAGMISFADVTEPLQLGESRTGVVLEVQDRPRRNFRVVDTAGRPVASIEVAFEERIFGATGWSAWAHLESASGSYTYEGRVPEARRVRVRTEGYAPVAARWRDGEVPTFEIRKARYVPFVVVGEHGRALRGVRVSAESVPEGAVEPGRKKRRVRMRRANTDRYGSASIELDPGMTWRVTTLQSGYEMGGPVLVHADDGGEGATPFRVVMETKIEPEPATVRGRLVRAGSGATIADLDFVGLRGGTFRVNGPEFEIRGLPPGKTTITARSGGFESVQLPVQILRAGESVDVGVISVRPATLVEVTVTDAGGKRAKGAKVSLHRLPPAKGGRADLPQKVSIPEAKGARGVFRRSGVGRAKWRLVVQRGKGQRESRIVSLSGARKRIQVRLGPGNDKKGK